MGSKTEPQVPKVTVVISSLFHEVLIIPAIPATDTSLYELSLHQTIYAAKQQLNLTD